MRRRPRRGPLDRSGGTGSGHRGSCAVGRATTVDEDVRLNCEAITRAVSLSKIVSRLDDRHRRLMAESDGVHRQIAAVQLGMLRAETDQLHV